MTGRSGRLVAAGLVVLGLLAAAAAWRIKGRGRGGSGAEPEIRQSAMVAAALRPLPADSWAVATIADVTGFRQRFAATAFGRLLGDGEVRAAAEGVLSAPDAGDGSSALAGALDSLAELAALGLRSFAVAVFPVDSGPASRPGVVAVTACDDPQRVAAWLDRRLAEAGPQDAPEGGAAGGTEYSCRSGVCRAIRANALWVGAPRAALDRALAAGPVSGRALDSDPRIAAALEETGAATAGYFAWIDLARAGEAVGRAFAGDPLIEKALALARLDAAAEIALAERADGELFHDRVVLRFDASRAGLLGLLFQPERRDLVADRLLPADLATASFGNLPDLAAMWDRAIESVRAGTPPAARAGIDVAVSAFNRTLGFDLRGDVLATFGGEWGIGWSLEDAAGTPSPASRLRLVALVGVRDPLRAERLVQALEKRLKAMGHAVAVAQVGPAKQWTALLGDDPARYPTLVLAPDRLLFATRAADARRLLAAADAPLSADPVYQTLRARLGGPADLVAFGRSRGASFRALLARAAAGEPAPAALDAFAAAVDRHLLAMPPSLAVARAGPGRIEYESLSPFNTGSGASLLAALAAPQLEAAAAARRTARSLEDVRTIGLVCEAYRLDRGAAPVADSLAALAPLVVPTYVAELPAADAWGYALDFRADGKGCVVASAGSDGRFEQDWTALCLAEDCATRRGPADAPGADLVWARGALLRAPAAELGE